jgi:hypothetical protein
MTANLAGSVTDASGAVIAGAKVTIKSLDTGSTRTDATDSKGDYSFSLLPVGRYALKVEAAGFKSYSVTSFDIHVGDQARLDARMTIGGVSETIEVTSGQAVLQTEDATVGNTLTGGSVEDLPLNGRNIMNMVTLTAGVQGQTSNGNLSYGSGGRVEDRRTGDTVSANGKSQELNNSEVDGFDNNDRAEGLVGLRPSIDGIQEVKVDTSSYAAENGRTAGAITNIITKSGANTVHGSAYEFLRNDVFDSWDYFAKHDSGVPGFHKPELRLNEFGGSLGGPIKKNKTFFFADVEEDRKVSSLIYPIQLPSSAELTPTAMSNSSQTCYDFSDAGFVDMASGNSYECAPVGSIALNYYQLFPASRAVPVAGSGASAQYQDVYFEPNLVQNSTTIDGRLDHRFTDKDSFFARYAYNPVSTGYPGPLPKAEGVYPNGNLQSAPSSENETAQQMQLTFTHIFNDHTIGELKAGYMRFNNQAQPQNFSLSTPADQTMGFPAGTYDIPGLPSSYGMTSQNMGGNTDSAFLGDAPSVPYRNVSNNYQILGSLTYTRGEHNLKFGASDIFRHFAYFQTGFSSGMFIEFANAPFESLLEDAPQIIARMNEMIQPMYMTSEPSLYAMDDWRITPSLTLNLGLRYEIFTPYSEAHGLYSNFIPETGSGSYFICGAQTAACTGKIDSRLGVKTDYKDISPRVGFAYSVMPKTVVRGAFGISYFPADVGNVAGGPNLVQMENAPYYFNYFSAPYPGGQCPSFEGTQSSCTGPNLRPGGPPQAVIGLPIPQEFALNMTPAQDSDTGTATGSWQDNTQISSLYYKDLNTRSSYVEQFNVSLQRQFGPHSITLAYVGDIGQALLRQTNADEPSTPGATAMVYGNPAGCNPGGCMTNSNTGAASSITHTFNGASEHYDAMQLVYSLKASNNLTVGANYVWAHALTDATFGATNQTAGILTDNRQYDFGNSDLDVRQRVTGHASYALPFANSAHGLTAVLAKGWQVNALGYFQTGMPFTVTSAAAIPSAGCPCDPTVTFLVDNSPVTVSSGYSGGAYIELPNERTDRPNSTGHTKLSNHGPAEWFDTKAFSPQTPGTLGNSGVNQVVGPPDRRVDVSVMKDFEVRESTKLQFRAECFNLTNTENFALPVYQLTNWDPTGSYPATTNGFGSISSTAFSENPRQFQFALKLLF